MTSFKKLGQRDLLLEEPTDPPLAPVSHVDHFGGPFHSDSVHRSGLFVFQLEFVCTWDCFFGLFSGMGSFYERRGGAPQRQIGPRTPWCE